MANDNAQDNQQSNQQDRSSTNNQPNQNDQQAGSAGVGDQNANDFTANENAIGGAPNNRPAQDTGQDTETNQENSDQGATNDQR